MRKMLTLAAFSLNFISLLNASTALDITTAFSQAKLQTANFQNNTTGPVDINILTNIVTILNPGEEKVINAAGENGFFILNQDKSKKVKKVLLHNLDRKVAYKKITQKHIIHLEGGESHTTTVSLPSSINGASLADANQAYLNWSIDNGQFSVFVSGEDNLSILSLDLGVNSTPMNKVILDCAEFKTLEEQFESLGGELIKIDTSSMAGYVYNPCIINYNEKIYMTFRVQEGRNNHSSNSNIYFAEISSQFKVIKSYPLIEGTKRNADARLSTYASKLFISYVHDFYKSDYSFSNYHPNVHTSFFNPNETIQHTIKPDIENNCTFDARQKNWLFFEKSNKFYIIDNIDPLSLWDATNSIERPTKILVKDKKLNNWCFGEPRASTNPIFIEEIGKWLVLFHSCLTNSDNIRSYFNGALLFDDDFDITHYTMLPIISSTSQYSRGLSYPLNAIIPYGCIRNKNDLVVSFGVNDAISVIGRFSLNKILNALNPVKNNILFNLNNKQSVYPNVSFNIVTSKALQGEQGVVACYDRALKGIKLGSSNENEIISKGKENIDIVLSFHGERIHDLIPNNYSYLITSVIMNNFYPYNRDDVKFRANLQLGSNSYLKGVSKYGILNKFLLAHPRTNFTPLNIDNLSIFFCGGAWDSRYPNLLNIMDNKPYFNWYGHPTHGIPERNSYRGFSSIPAQTIKKHGIALLLHAKANIENSEPASKIFEAAAGSAVIISDKLTFITEEFGDAVFYIDQNDPEEKIAQDIDGYYHWIITHPIEAQAMAKKAHSIFVERFTLEDQLTRLISFHQESLPLDGESILLPRAPFKVRSSINKKFFDQAINMLLPTSLSIEASDYNNFKPVFFVKYLKKDSVFPDVPEYMVRTSKITEIMENMAGSSCVAHALDYAPLIAKKMELELGSGFYFSGVETLNYSDVSFSWDGNKFKIYFNINSYEEKYATQKSKDPLSSSLADAPIKYFRNVDFIEGFSRLEDWGVWTESNQCKIRIIMSSLELNKKYEISFKMSSYTPKKDSCVDLQLLVNNVVVNQSRFTKDSNMQTLSVFYTKEVEKDLVINFLLNGISSPFENNENMDYRRLGVSIRDIIIK
ncbi:MAG: hypothetical protein Q8S21_04750 [Candidatus Paracaedibacteraceae bacterium]|nr:hypothetical protein [Candidatus Paracaedibacteraceae bacterium]